MTFFNPGPVAWRSCLLAVLLSLATALALAHGVSESDKGFLQGTTGMQTLPFLYLGAKHMVTGYDHLLFLCGVIFFLYRMKLLTLPSELEIYPGHQVGSACGAGLSGKPTSTIGFEKRFNQTLSMSREAFVDAVTSDIPPQPDDMARIIDTNLRDTASKVASA